MEDCMSSKFAMCVYFDQHYKQTKDLVEPINRTYCNKHGIEYINELRRFEFCHLKVNTKTTMLKVSCWHMILLTPKNFDYVFMLDADAVVLDH